MGFGSSVSAFTKGVSEKAKGNAEIMKLRNQISGEERTMNDLMLQLGKRYYELHKNGTAEGECADLVNDILFHENKARDLERQASEVRQATDAVKFTADPGQGADYGEFKSGNKPEGNKFCTKCGAPLQPGMIFCTKCGAKIG
ncbi:zinc-ribbon domain-containing protein [Lachnospiraceae bacterium XPB1003]|nr:zinc-ribbon domain-containing protein [Lachnospiraceae bacterium XPB1003]